MHRSSRMRARASLGSTRGSQPDKGLQPFNRPFLCLGHRRETSFVQSLWCPVNGEHASDHMPVCAGEGEQKAPAWHGEDWRGRGKPASSCCAATRLPEKAHHRAFALNGLPAFRLSSAWRGTLRRVAFRDGPPLVLRAPYCPHHFLGSQRLRQHVIASQIQHLRPKPVIGQSRCNDKGRRSSERLHCPQDVLRRAIRQRVFTDHDRCELNEIIGVTASPTNNVLHSADCRIV